MSGIVSIASTFLIIVVLSHILWRLDTRRRALKLFDEIRRFIFTGGARSIEALMAQGIISKSAGDYFDPAFLEHLISGRASNVRTEILNKLLPARHLNRIVIGICVSILGYMALRALGDTVPATDDSIFRERSGLAIHFYWNGYSETAQPDARLMSAHSKSVPVNEDGPVALQASNSFLQHESPNELDFAMLNVSPSYESRAAHPCPQTQQSEAGTVCSLSNGSTFGRDFLWFVRGKDTGSTFVSIRFPPAITTALGTHPAWEAKIAFDGKWQTKHVVGDPVHPRDWHPGEDRQGVREVLILLSRQHPEIRSINLLAGELMFKQQFLTSLGLTQRSFSVWSAVGSALGLIIATGIFGLIFSKKSD
jgi:hypothetical protein